MYFYFISIMNSFNRILEFFSKKAIDLNESKILE